MRYAVLGTGIVGRTVAAKLTSLGHEVVIGTRRPEATLARTEPDFLGNPPFVTWHADHPAVPLRTFAEAAAFGETVVNTTHAAPPRSMPSPRRAAPTWRARSSSTSPTRSTSPPGCRPR